MKDVTSVKAELKLLLLFASRYYTMWHPADVNTKVQLRLLVCSTISQKKDGCVYEATMASVETFRGFINERLSAAAEEIFKVFRNTVVEYEEEIERQRRLLYLVSKPEETVYVTGL